jgi:hypothetical protein
LAGGERWVGQELEQPRPGSRPPQRAPV